MDRTGSHQLNGVLAVQNNVSEECAQPYQKVSLHGVLQALGVIRASQRLFQHTRQTLINLGERADGDASGSSSCASSAALFLVIEVSDGAADFHALALEELPGRSGTQVEFEKAKFETETDCHFIGSRVESPGGFKLWVSWIQLVQPPPRPLVFRPIGYQDVGLPRQARGWITVAKKVVAEL
jgi:hypothetical protein